MASVYHGTPLTPAPALAAAAGRSFCVSYFRPDSVEAVEAMAPHIMYDNGAFSFWMQAVRAGLEPSDVPERDWNPYYEWLEDRLYTPGRWAVVPDRPGAASQLNDALLGEWPFGKSRGSPVWHMDGRLERLADLCGAYDRVCLGWIGDPKREPVGCDAYHRRMDEVSALMGNRWHPLHMLRGVAVGGDYPFVSCDSTSLAQNHHRYRLRLFAGTPDEWSGVSAYADKLERMAA
jgi:hypothetical protein